MGDVVLWSYMRPEMTKKSIQDITSWNQLKSLTVVIDGLRSTASGLEAEWRNQTIRVSEEFQSNKVELLVYDKNIGITNHVNRVQQKLLPKYPRAIWVEEDFKLDIANYFPLTQKMKIPEAPFMSCANGQANHSEVEVSLRTLFPPYWGQMLNLQLTDEIEKVRHDQFVDTNVVRGTLHLLRKNLGFPSNFLFEKQVDYWSNYFNWGIHSPNRWDSVATYVLWKFGQPAFVPPMNLITDIAHTDTRGMNKRHTPQAMLDHSFEELNSDTWLICNKCEMEKSRLSFSLSRLIKRNLEYKSRLIFRNQ